MARQKRLIGKLIGTIVDPATGELQGWVYEWNTGATSLMMRASPQPPADHDVDEAGEAKGATTG